jgi:hypothetical protein
MREPGLISRKSENLRYNRLMIPNRGFVDGVFKLLGQEIYPMIFRNTLIHYTMWMRQDFN